MASYNNVVDLTDDDDTLPPPPQGSELLARLHADAGTSNGVVIHDLWVPISSHTAKCDLCLENNKSVCQRCTNCNRQLCRKCIHTANGDGIHSVRVGSLDWTPTPPVKRGSRGFNFALNHPVHHTGNLAALPVSAHHPTTTQLPVSVPPHAATPLPVSVPPSTTTQASGNGGSDLRPRSTRAKTRSMTTNSAPSISTGKRGRPEEDLFVSTPEKHNSPQSILKKFKISEDPTSPGHPQLVNWNTSPQAGGPSFSPLQAPAPATTENTPTKPRRVVIKLNTGNSFSPTIPNLGTSRSNNTDTKPSGSDGNMVKRNNTKKPSGSGAGKVNTPATKKRSAGTRGRKAGTKKPRVTKKTSTRATRKSNPEEEVEASTPAIPMANLDEEVMVCSPVPSMSHFDQGLPSYFPPKANFDEMTSAPGTPKASFDDEMASAPATPKANFDEEMTSAPATPKANFDEEVTSPPATPKGDIKEMTSSPVNLKADTKKAKKSKKGKKAKKAEEPKKEKQLTGYAYLRATYCDNQGPFRRSRPVNNASDQVPVVPKPPHDPLSYDVVDELMKKVKAEVLKSLAIKEMLNEKRVAYMKLEQKDKALYEKAKRRERNWELRNEYNEKVLKIQMTEDEKMIDEMLRASCVFMTLDGCERRK